MSRPPRFCQTASIVPPGGSWFFQLGDEKVSSPVYELALRRVDALLKAHGVKTPADVALAEFMCPHMPKWFCEGDVGHSPVISVKDATKAALPYFGMRMVPADVITRRMEECQACPMHRRDFCLHCNGLDEWIAQGFGLKRPALPADAASGCCSCAKTLEAVIASVEYAKGDSIWEGVPETCWRNRQ